MKKSVKLLCIMFSFILSLTMAVEPLVAADITINDSELQEETTETTEEITVVENEDDEVTLPEADKEEVTGPFQEFEKEEMIGDPETELMEAGKVKLSWKIKKEGFEGSYIITVYDDEEKTVMSEETVVVSEPDQESVELSGLVTDKTYYVSVVPYENEVEGKELLAEVKILGTPAGLTAKAGDAKVTLTWQAVTGATSYEVYNVQSNAVIAKTDKTTYVHSNLKNNVTYSYKVRAVFEDEEHSFVSVWSEQIVSGKTAIVTPAVPSGVKIYPVNLGVKLQWNAVTGATSYQIYRYSSSKKNWVHIKTVTDTTYTNTGLTKGSTYKYKIKAVRSAGGVTATSGYSAQVSQKIGTYATGSVRPMYYKASVKKKTAMYSSKSISTNAKAGYLKAGTKVTVISHPSKVSGVNLVQVKLSNGKVYWVRRSRLNYYGSVYTSKDYTTQDKLSFVNSKGYSSSTKYLIWISTYTQKVNIYQGSKGNWKLIKTCRVATGKHSTPTPRGTYKITYKEKGWYYSTTCVKKIVHFAGRNSFHSRIYKYNGKLAESTIGRPASHGCVRMYMEDINYIYNNMPKGTTVISY